MWWSVALAALKRIPALFGEIPRAGWEVLGVTAACAGLWLLHTNARDAAYARGRVDGRDSVVTASAAVVRDVAPRIVYRDSIVTKWRDRIDTAKDSARRASVRVDTAIARLSESAQSDTTVRALVGAVHQLQADTARLFAAIVTERRAVDSLRLDYAAGLHALAVRVVFVQDSAQRAFDVEARRTKLTRTNGTVIAATTYAIVRGAEWLIQHRRKAR